MLNFIAIDLQLYKIIQITRVSFLGQIGSFHFLDLSFAETKALVSVRC